MENGETIIGGQGVGSQHPFITRNPQGPGNTRKGWHGEQSLDRKKSSWSLGERSSWLTGADRRLGARGVAFHVLEAR